MKIHTAILIFMSVCISCSTKIDNAPEMPEWLIGTWKMTQGEVTIYESWAFESDSTRDGKSWFMADADTSIIEKMKLLRRAADLYFIADVPQNNTPVYFKAITIDKNKYVFENPEHDFPQRIIYFTPHNDTLRARIEGGSQEKNFVFTRHVPQR